MNYLVNLSHVLNRTPRNSSQTQQSPAHGPANPRTSSTSSRQLSPPPLESSDSFSKKQPASRGPLNPPTDKPLTLSPSQKQKSEELNTRLPSSSQKSKSGPLEKQPSVSRGQEFGSDVSSQVTQGNVWNVKLSKSQEPTAVQIGAVQDHELEEMPEGAQRVGDKDQPKRSQHLPVQVAGQGFSVKNGNTTHHQGEVEVSSTLPNYKQEFEKQTPVGTLTGGTELTGPKLSGQGELKASRENGYLAHGKVEGSAIEGKTELELAGKLTEYINGRLKGAAGGSIKGDAVATVEYNRKTNTYLAKVGYSGTMGFEEKVLGELKLGPIKFSGNLGFQQGLSSNLGAGGGLQNGKFTLGMDAGLCLGMGLQGNVAMTVDGKAVYEQFQKLMSSVDHEQHARRQRAATTSDHLINTMSGMAF